MLNTLEKDHTEDADAAFIDIYRKLRPGEPPTPDSARALIENLFFNPKRYDMAKVGRHKVSKKLRDEYVKLPLKKHDLTIPNADPKAGTVDYQLSRADILGTVSYIVKLHNNDADYYRLDVDKPGVLQVTLSGVEGVDLSLELLDGTGTSLGKSERTGARIKEGIPNAGVMAGKYTLVVRQAPKKKPKPPPCAWARSPTSANPSTAQNS
jgi:hypothetical protein